MTDADRLKNYAAMTETSRKWTSVMDVKASFVSALDTAALAFIWTSAKLSDSDGSSYYLAIAASVLLLVSLIVTLRVILPRTKLEQAFKRDTGYIEGYEPISFFSYIATRYPLDQQEKFFAIVNAKDDAAFAQEALEQHFTISHIAQKKASGVALAGWIWMASTILIAAALACRS